MKSSNRSFAWIVLGLYMLSGVVSLSFEVLWARILAIQFGVTIFGVALTVSGFMAGLGIGSLLGVTVAGRIRSPLFVYGLLELVIALYGFTMPWLLAEMSGYLSALSGGIGLGGWYLIQGLASLLLMLLPAVVMGAGFPVLLRLVRRSGNAALVLERVYGINALGGACGALLPLLLLPAFGWTLATRLVAGLALLVAAGALTAMALTRHSPQKNSGNGIMTDAVPGLRTLLPYAGIGAASIMVEIGWTRLYGMVMLRTEYVLAVILAVFLAGIGIGGVLAKKMPPQPWLTVFAVLTPLGVVASLWLLAPVSSYIETGTFDSLADALLHEAGLLAAITLPVTLMLGAWLPLLARDSGGDGSQGARLYGANSLGAAAGGLLSGFVLIRWLGTPATIVLASLLLFASGMMFSRSRRAWGAALVIIAASWPVRHFPPMSRLLPEAQAESVDLYAYEDGISITHVVERPDGQRLLLSDMQRMDASTDPTAVVLQKNQSRLPLLLHPQARSVLFLGLGTGISASGSLPFNLERRDAVELSRGAIHAADVWFATVNDRVSRQLQVYHDDVRRFLMTSARKYDVIVGDVFHPDLVGRSALLSVQQFARERARLEDGGVMVQWLALNQFDIRSLRTVLRSFQQVFPDATLFIDGFRLAIVGGKDDKLHAGRIITRSAGTDAARLQEMTGGEGIMPWLGRYWGRIGEDAGAVQDEWWPKIEYHLPEVRYDDSNAMMDVLQWLFARRPEPAQAAAQLGIDTGDFPGFERSYVAMGLALRSWIAELEGQTGKVDRLIRFAYRADPDNRWVRVSLADSMLATLPRAVDSGLSEKQALLAILKVHPDHVETLRALWRLAEMDGDQDAAAVYRDRIRQLDPLGRLPPAAGL